MTTTTNHRLSDEQMAFFDEQGYLIVEDVFTDADLRPVIDDVNAAIDRKAAELVADGKLSQTYADEDFEHRLTKISEETDAVATSIWNGTLATPGFFELIRHPKLLDVAEQFVGPEIIASSVYRLRPKIPNHVQGPVPWHQDSGYVEPFCDAHLMLTVWLPLVNATRENGCMWVIPGVHKQGILKHGSVKDKPYLVIPAGELPKPQSEWVCCEVPKGGVLLLTNMCPHASFENATDMVRWSVDIRYQNAALPTNYDMTRLPGDLVASEGEGVPMACYPPEADFLVRSTARPEEVVTDASRFEEIRKRHVNPGMTHRWGMLD